MKPYMDVSNQVFGYLTAIRFLKREGRNTIWLFVCVCGKEVESNVYPVADGKKTSCGCKRIIDIIGQRFGKLVVTGYAGRENKRPTSWYVRCDCGNEKIVLKNSLTSGNTKSCGYCPKPPKPPKERKPRSTPKREYRDIAGQAFGRLTAVEHIGRGVWLCSCECGGNHRATSSNLLSGQVLSCKRCRGFIRSEQNIKNEIGNIYGDWHVIAEGYKRSTKGEHYWLCRCKCGLEKEVRGSHLRSGGSTMCRACRGLMDRVENPISGYPAEYSLQLRGSVRRRDNYICQYCDTKFGIGELDVHHIDHDRDNNEKINLVSLCNTCHYKMHRKDSDTWIPYWQSFMQEKYGD